jgi:hypothetical protein
MHPRVVNRLFGFAASGVVLATALAAMTARPTPQPSTTTLPTGSADVVVLGRDPIGNANTASAPRTVPVATTSTTTPSTTTVATGPIAESSTTSSTAPAGTPPSEVLVIGGNGAELIGPELARQLAPLRVRLLAGEPLSRALELLAPKPGARVIVVDPKVPAEAGASAAIDAVIAATNGAKLLWVQDWGTGHHWWVDLVAAQAAEKKYDVIAWHAEVDKKPSYRTASGALTVSGVNRLMQLLKPAAIAPVR